MHSLEFVMSADACQVSQQVFWATSVGLCFLAGLAGMTIEFYRRRWKKERQNTRRLQQSLEVKDRQSSQLRRKRDDLEQKLEALESEYQQKLEQFEERAVHPAMEWERRFREQTEVVEKYQAQRDRWKQLFYEQGGKHVEGQVMLEHHLLQRKKQCVMLLRALAKHEGLDPNEEKTYERLTAELDPLDAEPAGQAERYLAQLRRISEEAAEFSAEARLTPDEGTEHLVGGEFQSDEYPTCPRGKVPLSTKDEMAQDLLWAYAQRRRSVDPQFAADLETALRSKGSAFTPKPPDADPIHLVDRFLGVDRDGD